MADEEKPVEPQGEEGKPREPTEARREWEAAQKERLERQAEELREYQESRKEAIAAEEEEINKLREKRIARQKEREEEEKRLIELRAQEEVKRKAEEAQRKAQKEEEEAAAKEERERKRKEAEERMKPKGRSFKISKKSDSEKADVKLDSVMSKEELQKSKEQLEEEKQAILAQRIQPCVIDGLAADKLIEKAKELHEHIRRLEGDKYDLEQRFKRQQYDMIELAERSRQMNKGKGRGTTAVQVDESFDRLADKFTSAPPKILLCSKYERHTDHRSYGDRITHFEELAKEPPPPALKKMGGGDAAEGEEEEE